MTAVLAALTSIALAALIAVAGYAGPALLAAAAAVAVLAVALGWGTLLDLPAPRGSGIVVALTGWAGIGTAAIASSQAGPLAAFSSLLAFSVLVSFVHELARRDGRVDLVESVTGTVSGQVVAVLSAGWTLVPMTVLDVQGIVVGAVALAAARLATAVPLPARFVGWVSFAAGAAVGSAVAWFLVPGRVGAAAACAAAVAAVAAALDRLLSAQPSARSGLAMVAAAAAPVTAVGTVTYAMARLLAG